jgi:signal transduction histidine kinase
MLRGYGSGAVDFLMKPANSYVLRAKVQVFLDLYVSRRRLTSEITAHKRTLAALELANTALRHFTNAASHDLKAPLRAMRGFLGALHEDAGANLGDKASGYLDRSIQASRRMDSLLSSLLAYARLQKPPSCTLVPCQALLEQVKADLADQLAGANAVISLGELPTVQGDPERLYQLFLNLISNAIKFHRTDVPPIVAVRAEPQGNQSMFCVQDNGIGIGLEHREAVFTAFRRLHSESAYEGSGLGLAICKQIVEEHGGRIWVDSEPTRGSRFCLTLPLASNGVENPS